MSDTNISKDLEFVSLFGENITLNSTGLLATAIFYGVLFFSLSSNEIRLKLDFIGRLRDTLLLHDPYFVEGNMRAKFVLLVAVITMFGIASFFIASYMAMFVGGIQMILVNDVGTPIAEKVPGYQDKWKKFTRVEGVLFFLEVITGDFVVVWRAWALWSHNWKILIVPSLLLLGSAASTLALLGCFIENDWPITLPPTCSSLNIATYVLSTATNITATCAIGYKVWLHWRVVKKYLGILHARSGIEKVLVLLLESGVAYSVLWLLQVITLIPSVGTSPVGAYVQQILYAASVQLVGIYPTLVIVLVYLQRSLWDSSGSSTYVQAVVSEHSHNHHPSERGGDAELVVLKPTRLVLEDEESHRSSTLARV
ncbi:hypothetical protein Moror_12990 [Moniliophthora roreri MCA 2997]|uniref:Uncharacterized protein n=2 Tax=Moniliophthora roreri TaxID=221103 RepID=V2X418_MONRO|nr:hypothetical protein Moror_12990 [Moniliophthora roreri MCA 2997]KAI3608845.1 hypothetical protein WG66_003801 [Moniliophthora roreri]